MSGENILKTYKQLHISQEYNSFIPINANSKYINTYVILFQAIRLSALLHDVGHTLFSHVTEFALKDVWKIINEINKENRTERQEKYID
ncbi:hypothetical protein [Clostridium estertheticum]|uniref:hypothetical protein n=1 Tax=Clostridium estertheticum TaxID=238834 RepID=UPI001C0BA351|nr:hypothetical protein [Clostridium estertheticum]MBU3183750.1 hypothetical protein [Clostridium estertheticum]